MRRAVNRVRGDQNIETLIAAGLEYGEGAFVIHRAYLDPGRPWLIKLGARSAISSNVKVFTHDDGMKIQTGLTRIAAVELGERVFVGAGTIIRPGARIGANSIIAAGSVVSGEIPPGSVAAGHPARVITTVERFQAWHRQTLADAPVWPREGWIPGLGITAERKASQREALASVREGYSKPPASRRQFYVRSKVVEWSQALAAIGSRGSSVRQLKRLLADQVRGDRRIERHVRDGLQLGEGAFIADEAFVDGRRPWLITIGADSYLAPYVIILSHDGSQRQGGMTRIGRVDIGNRVYVGPGAMVLPGSQIGDDSVVEAGAVVRGSIPSGSYVAGNPATVRSDNVSTGDDGRLSGTSGPTRSDERSTSEQGTVEDRDRPPRRAPRPRVSARQRARRAINDLRGRQTLEQLIADGLELGERASVAPRAYLDPGRPWLITIGDDAVISDFAIIMAHDPRPRMPVASRLGRVVVGRRVFVAPGAIILPGSRIGDDSVVDVRAVVSGEIPPGSFVSGNPGRIAGNVEEMAEQWRQAAANAPVVFDDGSSADGDVSQERMTAQRDALAAVSDAYVRASAASG